jgi:hypothetical protein
MTVVRTVATHEVVQRTYPRPATEKDEFAMAVGKAIDGALSRYSHEFSRGRKPTATSMNRFAADVLKESLRDADVTVPTDQHEKVLTQIAGVLQAFRRSEVFGLARPRTRLVLIDERVGVYAQPDYWDGKSRFFEMKSYDAIPMPREVELQMRMFQLAYPGFSSYLISFNRHVTPVETRLTAIPPPTAQEVGDALTLAYQAGMDLGQDKVLEYIDNPIVRYRLHAPA